MGPGHSTAANSRPWAPVAPPHPWNHTKSTQEVLLMGLRKLPAELPAAPKVGGLLGGWCSRSPGDRLQGSLCEVSNSGREGAGH